MKFKKPFFIAEISANHEGSLNKAYTLIRHAKIYGADAVKLQTFTPEKMTLKSKKKYFKINNGIWKNKYLWDLYSKAQTPLEWHSKLFKFGKKVGIKIFSTPFDETAVDFLEKLNCPFYKVSSFEMTDLELIKHISKTKKPIIISTGTSALNEIELAYKTAKKYGAKDISLLYCVSNYPAKNSDFNIKNIEILKKEFNCEVGLSDHSKDKSIALLSAYAGASIFEKHICIKNSKGLDSKFSIYGNQILDYRKEIDKGFELRGKNYFFRSFSESKAKKFRKSLWAIKKIKKGQEFNSKNIMRLRPGDGLSPIYFSQILKKKAPYNITDHSPLSKDLIKKLKLKK
jgi:pseudaminic acid synthase